MQKIIKTVLVLIVGISALLLFFFQREVTRLYHVIFLFEPNNIVYNFQNMAEILPHRTVTNGPANFQFKTNLKPLPSSVDISLNAASSKRPLQQTINVKQLLTDTATTGFIVIKDQQILHESYYLGMTPETLHISWSINKSFISALIGRAIADGLIDSINDPITQYVPELINSGYHGVPIKHILQMSSGVAFNEDYADFYSDINRMGRVIALGSSINEFAAGLKKAQPSGTQLRYVSMDTQVLGMLLQKVTNKTLSDYLQQTLWQKIGATSEIKWLIDDNQMELAFGTLNLTLRDYARFGQLYLNRGYWEGESIIPADWVDLSTSAQADYLKPSGPNEIERYGYGYQWWLPPGDKNDFLARGVYGQYIYLNRTHNVVIVKTSADPNWKANSPKNLEVIKLFQALAESY
ncbi:serine hydrolase domain-containing protein [Aliikangiella sp. IMCC44653]